MVLKIDENPFRTKEVTSLSIYGVLVSFKREKKAIQSLVRSLNVLYAKIQPNNDHYSDLLRSKFDKLLNRLIVNGLNRFF